MLICFPISIDIFIILFYFTLENYFFKIGLETLYNFIIVMV